MSVMQVARKFLRRKADPINLLNSLLPAKEQCSTLIHAGAHLAQERHHYEDSGFRRILWIEGSPSVYARLDASLREYTGPSGVSAAGAIHESVCSLLADRSDSTVEFHEFSNDGESSSMFPPTEEKRKRWPKVFATGQRETLRTRTLDDIAQEMGYADTTDVLVVDVQGAELLVLKGAERVLRSVKAVVAEVSTVPYYEGGVLFPELRNFLLARGFISMSFPRRHGDMLFLRADLGGSFL